MNWIAKRIKIARRKRRSDDERGPQERGASNVNAGRRLQQEKGEQHCVEKGEEVQRRSKLRKLK